MLKHKHATLHVTPSHRHTHTHTHTPCEHLKLLWEKEEAGEIGPFKETSHNIPQWYTMDGGDGYELAHVILCLFVCERVNVCV